MMPSSAGYVQTGHGAVVQGKHPTGAYREDQAMLSSEVQYRRTRNNILKLQKRKLLRGYKGKKNTTEAGHGSPSLKVFITQLERAVGNLVYF